MKQFIQKVILMKKMVIFQYIADRGGRNPAHILSTSQSEETEGPEKGTDTFFDIKWKKLSPKIHDYMLQQSKVVGNNLNRPSKFLDYFCLHLSEDLVKVIAKKTTIGVDSLKHFCEKLPRTSNI